MILHTAYYKHIQYTYIIYIYMSACNTYREHINIPVISTIRISAKDIWSNVTYNKIVMTPHKLLSSLKYDYSIDTAHAYLEIHIAPVVGHLVQ